MKKQNEPSQVILLVDGKKVVTHYRGLKANIDRVLNNNIFRISDAGMPLAAIYACISEFSRYRKALFAYISNKKDVTLVVDHLTDLPIVPGFVLDDTGWCCPKDSEYPSSYGHEAGVRSAIEH